MGNKAAKMNFTINARKPLNIQRLSCVYSSTLLDRFRCRWIVGNKEWNTLQNATQKAYGGIALSMRILCKRVLIEVLIMASLWKRICPTRLVQGKIILYNQAVKMVVLAPKM